MIGKVLVGSVGVMVGSFLSLRTMVNNINPHKSSKIKVVANFTLPIASGLYIGNEIDKKLK